MRPSEQARPCFAGDGRIRHSTAIQAKAQRGDIIVGGRNFGTGSSREQAATALKYRGIQLLIAASFSQTYSRNAFNNGYICLDCPELADAIASEFAEKAKLEKTVVTGLTATVDFVKATVSVGDREWSIPPPRLRAESPAERSCSRFVTPGQGRFVPRIRRSATTPIGGRGASCSLWLDRFQRAAKASFGRTGRITATRSFGGFVCWTSWDAATS